MKLTLTLPLDRFEALHESADGRGQMCRVPKEDVAALLADHSKALALLLRLKVPFEEPGFDLEGYPEALRKGL